MRKAFVSLLFEDEEVDSLRKSRDPVAIGSLHETPASSDREMTIWNDAYQIESVSRREGRRPLDSQIGAMSPGCTIVIGGHYKAVIWMNLPELVLREIFVGGDEPLRWVACQSRGPEKDILQIG